MMTLAKVSKQNQIAKPIAKPITVKTVMLLDTGDGCFIDGSVKVKPHKTDASKLALKCVDRVRLLDAVKRMGLTLASPPVKGGKHWIAFVWKGAMQTALAAHAAAAQGLPAPEGKALAAPAKQLAKGGAK